MARKKGIIFLMCFLVLGVNMTGCSGNVDPMSYYRKAESLNQEASNAMMEKKFESALTKSKDGLKRLELIKNEFPKWQYIPSKVAPLEAEFTKRINLIESRLLIMHGYDYQQKGAYAQALKEYNVVLDKYKDQPQNCATAQRAIGDTYFQQGKYDDALQAYAIVMERYKENSRFNSAIAQAFTGKVHILMGRYEDALKAHRVVLNEYKDQIDACVIAEYEIGDIYRRMGRYDEALKAWQKLVNEYGNHPYAKITKIILESFPIESFQKMEQENEIILPLTLRFFSNQISDNEFLSSAIKMGEEFKSVALYLIGANYQMDGKTDEAVKYYQECIDASKDKDLVYNTALKSLNKIKNK